MNIQKLDALLYAINKCIKRPVLITSFGPSTLVIIDRIVKLGLSIPIMTIDTGYSFPETLELKCMLESHYGIEIGIISANTPQTKPNDSESCCFERKVQPLGTALAQFDCWLTGTRRDQNENRRRMKQIDRDSRKRGLLKIAPLSEWTEKQVWGYLVKNNIPYNPLHNQGYNSIGCWPCTQPGIGRAGRWGGKKTECGIHSIQI